MIRRVDVSGNTVCTPATSTTVEEPVSTNPIVETTEESSKLE